LDTAAAQARRTTTTGDVSDTSREFASGDTLPTVEQEQQWQAIHQDLRHESIRLRSQLDLKESEARRLRLQLSQSDRQLAECRSLLMEVSITN
jgi:hypothetical protein